MGSVHINDPAASSVGSVDSAVWKALRPTWIGRTASVLATISGHSYEFHAATKWKSATVISGARASGVAIVSR